MMINVICILLLKIGWSQPNFGAIGINSYWVGIIAFVFGAKATQTYFESKLAVPPAPTDSTLTPDTAEAVNAAIAQNQNLRSKFPNIVSMLLGSKLVNGQNVLCVDIHLSDNNTANIPDQLPVNGGGKINVPVNIIANIGAAKASAGSGDALVNQTANTTAGTLTCFLTDDKAETFHALSCCHVFTGGGWIHYTGYDVPANQQIVDNVSHQSVGDWAFGLMNERFDIAYTTFSSAAIATKSGLKSARDVNDADIRHKTPVSFKGSSTPNGAGIISNYKCTRTIGYGGDDIDISNLILIGTNAGISPSRDGDSGALVYTDNANEPIGVLIAADTVFSYVIPMTTILSITGKSIY